MTEHLDTTDQVFIPVIFNEDETEFIMRPVSEIGYHFKYQVTDVPVLAEGQKLEVSDEAMAGFVTNCLSYWSGLSERIIAAHHKAQDLDQKYNRRRLSLAQHENVRKSIERSTMTINRAAELMGRLSLAMTETK